MGCHFLLQWTTLCQNSSLWPICLRSAWHGMADHFIKLCKPLHHNKAVIRRVDGHWPPANPVWRRVILFPQGNHSSLPSPLGTIYLLSRLFTGACWVASVVSGSSWPYGLGPVRFLSPRDSPGINTGVGCHALLQGIFPIQVLKPCLLYFLCWQVGSLPLGPPRKQGAANAVGIAHPLSACRQTSFSPDPFLRPCPL